MEQKTMTYAEWVEKFKPVENDWEPAAPYEGTMYETFGIQLQEVKTVASVTPSYVWTLCDSDGYTIIKSGYHHVDRIGYFLTLEPHRGDELFVTVREPSDDDMDDLRDDEN